MTDRTPPRPHTASATEFGASDAGECSPRRGPLGASPREDPQKPKGPDLATVLPEGSPEYAAWEAAERRRRAMHPADWGACLDAAVPLPVLTPWGLTLEQLSKAGGHHLPHVLLEMERRVRHAVEQQVVGESRSPGESARALRRTSERLPVAWRPGSDADSGIRSLGKFQGRLGDIRRLLIEPDRLSAAKKELWRLYCELTDPDRSRGARTLRGAKAGGAKRQADPEQIRQEWERRHRQGDHRARALDRAVGRHFNVSERTVREARKGWNPGG